VRLNYLGTRPAPATLRNLLSRIVRGHGPAIPVERRFPLHLEPSIGSIRELYDAAKQAPAAAVAAPAAASSSTAPAAATGESAAPPAAVAAPPATDQSPAAAPSPPVS